MTKNILITGANGFVGSNCAEYFKNSDIQVYGIDVFGCASKNFILGEINLANLKSFNQKFDTIIHLAGSGTVGAVTKDPQGERAKTIDSTECVLEFIKKYNSNAKLIYASSAAVYGNLYDKPIKETDELNPISEYGKQKIEAEALCLASGLDVNIVRFFSIYGEGLKKQLLWDFSNRILNTSGQKTLRCFGTGTEKRDFIHIKDAIKLIDILIRKDIKASVLNCGTSVSTCVEDVLELIKKEFNSDIELVYDNAINEGDPKVLVADTHCAQELGFAPKITIKEGFRDYVEWFKRNS